MKISDTLKVNWFASLTADKKRELIAARKNMPVRNKQVRMK